MFFGRTERKVLDLNISLDFKANERGTGGLVEASESSKQAYEKWQDEVMEARYGEKPSTYQYVVGYVPISTATKITIAADDDTLFAGTEYLVVSYKLFGDNFGNDWANMVIMPVGGGTLREISPCGVLESYPPQFQYNVRVV